MTTETQTHTPGPWAIGRTLTTPQTREWSNAEWVENDLREGKLVFASFSAKDQGRSRELVAECRTLADAKLVAAAPELLEAVRDLLGSEVYADGEGMLSIERGGHDDTEHREIVAKAQAAIEAAS